MTRNLAAHTIVIDLRNFKILPFLLHDYYTPQLKNIAILAMTFSFQNFKVLPILHMELFWAGNPT